MITSFIFVNLLAYLFNDEAASRRIIKTRMSSTKIHVLNPLTSDYPSTCDFLNICVNVGGCE
jgi:hypothetical protein